MFVPTEPSAPVAFLDDYVAFLDRQLPFSNHRHARVTMVRKCYIVILSVTSATLRRRFTLGAKQSNRRGTATAAQIEG